MNTKAMKSVVIVVFLLLTGISVAQTASPTTYNMATFIWNGSTDSSQLIELSTINGQPVNQATGYGGAIQVVNGQFLWLLELPESLGFPNSGFLDCETLLTFSAKQWGTRPDGSTMDGIKAGDCYYLSGTTSCSLWNGTADISITVFREFIQHHYCGRGGCRTYLVDTMESGSGTATVE